MVIMMSVNKLDNYPKDCNQSIPQQECLKPFIRVKLIQNIIGFHGIPEKEICAQYGVKSLTQMTSEQANHWLRRYALLKIL